MLSEHPLVALLEMKSRRQKPTPVALWCLALALPALALYALPGGDEPVVRLLALVLLAAAYPLSEAARAGSAIGGLPVGELTDTRVTSREMVDGVALYAAQRVLRAWRWLLPLWTLWSLVLGFPLYAGLLGFPLQVALGGVAGWASLAGYAWSTAEDDLLLRSGLMAGVTLPLLGLSLWFGPWAWAAMALPWAFLARLGLDRAGGWREKLGDVWRQMAAGEGNRWARLGVGAANPIVYREMRAEARRIPGGLVSWVAWRHGLTLALLTALVILGPAALWAILVMMLLLQTLQSAYRTVGSVVEERENGTLETLMSSRLSARQWVDGWALVGWLPRGIEAALALPVLAWVASEPWSTAPPLPVTRAALALGVLVLVSGAAGYAGILASAASPSRAQAHDRLGLDLCFRLWALGILGLLVTLAAPPAWAWVPLPAAAGLLLWLRRDTLRKLSVTSAVPLFPLLYRCLRLPAPARFMRRLMARLEVEGLLPPAMGPVLSLGLHRPAPEGFKARLLDRWEEEA